VIFQNRTNRGKNSSALCYGCGDTTKGEKKRGVIEGGCEVVPKEEFTKEWSRGTDQLRKGITNNFILTLVWEKLGRGENCP